MDARAIVFDRPGHAELQSCAVEAPKYGEVQIKMNYTVVSAGTEYAFLMGSVNTAGNFPRKLGYSASAEIIAIGDGVTGYKPGDRVIAYHGKHQSINNIPVDKVYPIPDGVSDTDAAFTEIACMGLQGVRKLRPELGETGMVIGLGLLGMFAVRFMVLNGLLPVFAVDLDTNRLEICKKLGAKYTLSSKEPDFLPFVKKATNNIGVNCIVEVTGAESALHTALDVVAREGRISLTGCTRAYKEPFDFYKQVMTPGVQIIGAHNGVRPQHDSRPGYWTRHADERTVLNFMAEGLVTAEPLIHEIAMPTSCTNVYERLANRKLPLGILFDWTQM